MQTQWLLRECFSVILEGELHLKQLSQLVSTIPVSVGIKSEESHACLESVCLCTLVRCDMEFIKIC